MLSITIPLWLWSVAAGLPLMVLLLLVVQSVRARRRKSAPVSRDGSPSRTEAGSLSEDFAVKVHRQILEQQIDAVFDALVTVIGAERMKLKALLNHPLSPDTAGAPAATIGAKREPEVAEPPNVPSVAEQVARLADDGMAPDRIARRLGLSGTEVSLAIKMQSGRAFRLGRKVEAVA